MNMRHTTVALALCVTLLESSLGLVVRKGEPDPKEALTKFKEKAVAEDYMDKWKDKSWENAKPRDCDTDSLPTTTDRVIEKVCGKVEDGDRCVCNTAKAHSCHVGCQKAEAGCPNECKRHASGVGPPGVSGCYAGDPKNGGKNLTMGLHGECTTFCSQSYGPVRYCGVGGIYQAGIFVDCTGCHPVGKKQELTRAEKKEEWEKCMVGCYPTPSCVQMCAQGTPACYLGCVADYRHVVEPYYELFKGSLERIPISAKVTGPNNFKNPEAVTKEDIIDEHEPPIGKAVIDTKAIIEKKAVTFKESEAVEEDSGEESAEDDYAYGDGDEGYSDPFAGENEWDEGKGELNFHGGRQKHKKQTDENIVKLFGIHPKRKAKREARAHKHRHKEM